MTVAELIQALQAMPADARVMSWRIDSYGYATDAEEILIYTETLKDRGPVVWVIGNDDV